MLWMVGALRRSRNPMLMLRSASIRLSNGAMILLDINVSISIFSSYALACDYSSM